VNFVLNLSQKDDGTVSGSVNPKLALTQAGGIDVSASANTANELKLEVTAKDLLGNSTVQALKGLKTTLIGTVGKERTLSAGLEYKSGSRAAFTSSLDIYHQTRTPVLALSSLVSHSGLFFGAAADYKFSTPADWSAVQSILGFQGKSFTATLASVWSVDKDNKETQSVNSTLYYDLAAHDLTLAATVDYDLLKTTDPVSVAIVGAKKANKDTTVKAKLDTRGKLGLSCVSRLNPNLKITLGGEFNTRDLSPAGNHKWGLSLALEE